MRYLVLAWDGDDPDAPARRQKARAAHIACASRLQAEGHLLVGGALLDDDGNMIGTAAIAEFATRDELDQWIATDPYTTEGVWKKVSVTPYRVAEHYTHLYQPD